MASSGTPSSEIQPHSWLVYSLLPHTRNLGRDNLINLNKGRRKSARILLGLEVNIWLIYSFIDPVLVQPKQSKMMKHFQNLYGPASLFCYVGDIFSFQSPFYYLPLRHPRWSRVINDHWSHLDMEGCGQTCSSLVWFCIQPGVYKKGNLGSWFHGSRHFSRKQRENLYP